MTVYHKASAHTIARRTLYRRRRPLPSLSRPFRASTYRRRRSLFAEAIEPPVNVFSDWSRPRALCMVEKGAPPAQAGRSLVPVQAPSTGRSGGTSVAEMRAAARRSSRPEDPLDEGRDCSRARRPPAASRAGDAVRSCPLRFGHWNARTGHEHVRPVWYRSLCCGGDWKNPCRQGDHARQWHPRGRSTL